MTGSINPTDCLSCLQGSTTLKDLWYDNLLRNHATLVGTGYPWTPLLSCPALSQPVLLVKFDSLVFCLCYESVTVLKWSQVSSTCVVSVKFSARLDKSVILCVVTIYFQHCSGHRSLFYHFCDVYWYFWIIELIYFWYCRCVKLQIDIAAKLKLWIDFHLKMK